MTIVVICPDCSQEAEYRNGPDEVFVARLKCVDGCPPLPEDDLDDPDATSHLASIRQEDS